MKFREDIHKLDKVETVLNLLLQLGLFPNLKLSSQNFVIAGIVSRRYGFLLILGYWLNQDFISPSDAVHSFHKAACSSWDRFS